MTSLSIRRSIPMVFAAAAALALAGPVPAVADAGGNPSTTYSGRGTVVRADVAGIANVLLADTGPLPAGGGAREASLLTAAEAGFLEAEVLHAATVGQNGISRSEAAVSGLNVMVAGATIAADFVMSQAEASFEGGLAFTTGSSEIVELTVNGLPVVVTGEPNQTVMLPLGRLVINEQVEIEDLEYGEITVTALRIEIPGFADVALSTAYADIRGGRTTPDLDDFATGGGFIVGPTGANANFGVAGGEKKTSLWGHLSFIDHGIAMRVDGIEVTDYQVVDEDTRLIRGICEIDGLAGFTYEVEVTDRGEPGLNDEFSLELSNGYSASGFLSGGNIQLHPAGL